MSINRFLFNILPTDILIHSLLPFLLKHKIRCFHCNKRCLINYKNENPLCKLHNTEAGVVVYKKIKHNSTSRFFLEAIENNDTELIAYIYAYPYSRDRRHFQSFKLERKAEKEKRELQEEIKVYGYYYVHDIDTNYVVPYSHSVYKKTFIEKFEFTQDGHYGKFLHAPLSFSLSLPHTGVLVEGKPLSQEYFTYTYMNQKSPDLSFIYKKIPYMNRFNNS